MRGWAIVTELLSSGVCMGVLQGRIYSTGADEQLQQACLSLLYLSRARCDRTVGILVARFSFCASVGLPVRWLCCFALTSHA